MSQQINLFNPIFLYQKKIFAARTLALSLGLLSCGALAIAATAWYSVSHLRREAAAVTLQAAAKQARLVRAAVEFAPRQANAILGREAGDAVAQLAALRHVADILNNGGLGNTQGYASIFRALARQHQDGLWLTGVNVGLTSGGSGSGGGGVGSDLSLQGRALNATLVPAYIERLTREAVLQGKSFGNLQITQPALPAAATPVAAAPLAFIEFSLQANAAEVKP
ncbi:MAG: hypothetical protein M3Y65_12820 [Pseudomonadota bacterium]|nr:hypothetical protein [Pseudomonadota bacterium]